MNNIDFYQNSEAGNRTSPSRPKRIPTARRSPTMKKFSLSLLFTLKSTSSPTPALENRPAIITPTEIIPSAQSVERTTEAAQFGIRPTRAATV